MSEEEEIVNAINALQTAALRLGMTVGTVHFHGLPDYPLKMLGPHDGIYHQMQGGKHSAIVLGIPVKANQEKMPEC